MSSQAIGAPLETVMASAAAKNRVMRQAALGVDARWPLLVLLLRCGRRADGRGAATAARVGAEWRPPHVLL